ncbi:MFS transporter [Desulfosporosinus fructosivorans]|nr:MFS transporter [Desulfosporosinus fructosivorans]
MDSLSKKPIDVNTQQNDRQQKALITGRLAHLIHDGFTDMLYVFFPIWQGVFGLSFAEVGFLKTLFSGTMALFQIPAGMLANRVGEFKLLLIGTVMTSFAVIFYGLGTTPILLGCLLVIGGFGSSVQHPLSSSLISSAYQENRKRRIALSTYNVSGDFGKLLLPSAAAFLITQFDWQTACHILGIFGVIITIFLYFTSKTHYLGKLSTTGEDTEVSPKGGQFIGWNGNQLFWVLSTIGVFDSATRMGFLMFFPFLLQGKGADITLVGLALTLVFAGGATGKFVCGVLATRLGALRTIITTESLTALCIYGIIILPLYGALVLAPLLGLALNGTSSVLYGSVPELVSVNHQKQAFAIFYTATIGAGSISPFLYGIISDAIGLKATVMIIAVVVLLTIPLTLPLRKKLAD